MSRINVVQVIDTLDAGGAERVAVNVANMLPRDRFRSALCTTRHDGSLAALVDDDVQRISLGRKARFDLPPLRRLAHFIAAEGIQIVHAHSSALFAALAATLGRRNVSVVWHVHHSGHVDDRRPWIYRIAARRIDVVVAVSEPVADWVIRRVRVSRDRVLYVPNFTLRQPIDRTSGPDLPGARGCRIACVANLRPEKDHGTLLRAMARIVKSSPQTHLLLIGGGSDRSYRLSIERQIAEDRLENHVSLLGERHDVSAILSQCDIGVLSSAIEGFPLALVEYGHAGLPVVATRVGQCADMLDDGASGVLVDRGDSERLASALLSLLDSADERHALGASLRRRVEERFSPGPILDTICGLYERLARAGAREQAPVLSC